MPERSRPLEYTPTWVVAAICSVIVFVSFCAERGLHRLGKYLSGRNQNLFEALQRLKEELMLLGFISLLLTVLQDFISHICIPTHLASYMLPCKLEDISSLETILKKSQRITSEISGLEHCPHEGKLPVLSLDAVHQLHIFIFVLAVVHVVFAATTVVLGVMKMRQWKHWDDKIRSLAQDGLDLLVHKHRHEHHHQFFMKRAIMGHYRKLPVVRWVRSFFKQFYGSVTESDYIALRSGFIEEHCPSRPEFRFHEYMLRTLAYDFKKIVGISWYLWIFVLIFLLLNIQGWHTFFWLSYLPLVLLLLVGAKLEHIITRLARDVVQKRKAEIDNGLPTSVKPSNEHFCFQRPGLVLYLLQFILFQNSFEIAFFIWIWGTHGFKSCVMEKLGYIIPRLVVGVIVQVICSYITLPLYAIVTQMGNMFKQGIFNDYVHSTVEDWAEGSKVRVAKRGASTSPKAATSQVQNMENQPFGCVYVDEEIAAVDDVTVASIIELSSPNQIHQMPSP